MHVVKSSIMKYSKKLELEFSPSRWSKRYKPEEVVTKHNEFITKVSNETKQSIPCKLNIAYGFHKEEKLDIFGTHLPNNSPIFVFIHGGYWQELHRDVSSYVAKPLVQNGIQVIVLGYTLCPNTTIHEILQQIEAAIKKCLQYANNRSSKGIYLCGHSAGATLLANLFQTFLQSLLPYDQRLIKKIFLISGIYDLTPLTQTYINDALCLNKNSAKQLSPLLQPLNITTSINVYVIVAQNDSNAFKGQAQLFHKKLVSIGCISTYVLVKDVDHFDIVEKLTEENYELVHLISEKQ